MTDPGTTLGDVIHQRSADLTRAERRVARTLLAGNPMAGFDTVARIVGRLGEATRRRISARERLREGYARDDREAPPGSGERTR